MRKPSVIGIDAEAAVYSLGSTNREGGVDPDLVVIFGTLGATAVTLGGIGLFGFRMWLKQQRNTLESMPEALRRQIDDAVRDQVAAVLEERDREMEELHERLDFTERLLAQQRKLREPSDHPTPS